MSVRVFSAALTGIDAQLIEVEVDSAPGIHAFTIVGLPDKAVQESQDRIASAIRNTRFEPPSSKNKKFIINLAPADLKKEGPAYDLPIAMGYLLQSGQVKFNSEKRLFAGELSLDGSLKHTSGVLATTLLAKERGFDEIIIPASNTKEAAIIEGIQVIGAQTLSEVIGHLDGTARISPVLSTGYTQGAEAGDDHPLLFIRGQESAKRALMVAAAGSHNILMGGAPGAGKTILAKAFGELLPPLDLAEAIEVAKIYSALGLIKDTPLSFRRPFRNPHHTTSAVAVIGGGTWPRPGEISLAHRGVLFLDELPEFPRNVLEALRQPLEDGTVQISRAAGSVALPAKFALVAAMNPCPCGNYGDSNAICVCPAYQVLRYRKKVSGPLLDRIDIQINVSRETVNSAPVAQKPEDVTALRTAISQARQHQTAQLATYGIRSNAEISYKNIDRLCQLSPAAIKLLEQAVNAKHLSMRAFHKIKKLAKTIANLEQTDLIAEHHVAEAISLRVNESLFSDLG